MKPSRSRLAIAVVWLLVIGCAGGDRADSSFVAAVANPSYGSNGPRVLFDEGHHNHHRAGSTYRPFVRLIESDGYRVSRGRQRVSSDVLDGVDVLVVAGALGTNERNDDAAFAPEECDAIQAWVASGGALLLATDHYPFGHAVAELAGRFGVSMSKGVVEDTAHYDRSFNSTHIVYAATTGGLAAHPIIRGRDTSETVRKVLTFTGQAVSASSSPAIVLRSSGTAVMRPPEPVVERDGNDIRVHVAYGDPEPAFGWGQAVALEWGKGRVVVTADAAMLTAQVSGFDGRRFGMSSEGYDNRQLVLNIMRWLTRRL